MTLCPLVAYSSFQILKTYFKKEIRLSENVRNRFLHSLDYRSSQDKLHSFLDKRFHLLDIVCADIYSHAARPIMFYACVFFPLGDLYACQVRRRLWQSFCYHGHDACWKR